MDIERHPHRSTSSGSTTSSTSELFICFTSRLSSSSSMRCILSPGRAREPSQISLSASLSRRLKTNGSIKGGQSPMFTKKRGAGFENVEPSSPKVTCIGQVRVKTKKQGKKMRTRSKRRSGGGGGDVSFRRVDQNKNPNQDYTITTNNHVNPECLPHRNQRWVHLPVTICEALRTFGAELNCFIPCRSNCMKEKEAAEKTEGSEGSSCGAVFARWLVAVEEGEGKGREIELVVGEEGRAESSSSSSDMMTRTSRRRHVFEEIEFKEEMFETKTLKSEEEEEGRVGICIPPKNALLLMRCRSDPVKMAALANKFWEAPEIEEEEEAEVEQQEDGKKEKSILELEREFKVSRESEECEKLGSCVTLEEEDIPEVADTALVVDGPEGDVLENLEGNKEICEAASFEKQEEEAEIEQQNQPEPVEESQETEASSDLVEFQREENVPMVQESEEHNLAEIEPEIINRADNNVADHSDEIDETVLEISSSGEEQVAEELLDREFVPEPNQIAAEEEETEYTEKTCQEGQSVTHQRSEPEYPETQENEVDCESKEETVKTESTASVLPDCLLLMMCEPKLSMEVSKETWVCRADFIKCLPVHSRPANKTAGGAKPLSKVYKTDGGDESKKRISIDSNPLPVQQLHQPPRSSCSYPSAVAAFGGGVTSSSMANMFEKKLVGGKVYEPFVLTRCNSEPRRSAAKVAAPEACFWKNRKLEPHRPAATLGVGAAGVGF